MKRPLALALAVALAPACARHPAELPLCRVEFAAPLNISNLMLMCPKCNQATRVAYKYLEGQDGRRGSKVRVCRKCNATID